MKANEMLWANGVSRSSRGSSYSLYHAHRRISFPAFSHARAEGSGDLHSTTPTSFLVVQCTSRGGFVHSALHGNPRVVCAATGYLCAAGIRSLIRTCHTCIVISASREIDFSEKGGMEPFVWNLAVCRIHWCNTLQPWWSPHFVCLFPMLKPGEGISILQL